ncbi:hypothetical protein [Streptomyces wuyuanensis]|uniref:hypothetical protein n=1 Tax=Streptomyces wuyuanensis TaxID=1196353 RepID=UPI003428B973
MADWPAYGSAEWMRLDPRDPRCYAATLEAAELHRRAEAERQRLDHLMDHDPEAWWHEMTSDANDYAATLGRSLATQRAAEERRIAHARAATNLPHQLQATPGWPPIAIPGQPGWFRHCGTTGEQLDLPTADPGAAHGRFNGQEATA